MKHRSAIGVGEACREAPKKLGKIALSLSGGGFRAMLFHLGVIRYLRDAGILKRIDTISAVSGGAIIGAHLVLNWNRYLNGHDRFIDATKELLNFAKRDVRGRITRRLLWAVLAAAVPWVQVTRGSLFRRELKRFFGKKAELLSQASREANACPHLFVLATNLTTGWSSSFNQEAFIQDGPQEMNQMRTEALSTAFAVGASASFPAFFPPFEITASHLGVSREAFLYAKQYLTDGGVFDNLGVRKLQLLQDHGADFDLIVISDGGAIFEPTPGRRFAGIFGTAIRAADILFRRVQRLEYEILEHRRHAMEISVDRRKNHLMIPIRITDETEADGAPAIQIQRAVSSIRTDLDEFSDTEIKWLLRHGFMVAKQAIEAKIAALSDIGVHIDHVESADPCEHLYQNKDLVIDRSKENREWEILKKGARRRLRIFSRKDWVSWVNVCVLFGIFVGIFWYYGGLITDRSFFSDAYTDKYTVSIKYDDDIVMRWYETLDPTDQARIRPYVEDKAKEIPDSSNQFVLDALKLWRNSEGKKGKGRAYLSVLAKDPTGKSYDPAEVRVKKNSEWVGVLYYEFPPPSYNWTFNALFEKKTYKYLYDTYINKSYTIIHFRGNLIAEEIGPLCLTFLQRPMQNNPRRKYTVQFNAGLEVINTTRFPVYANCESKGEGHTFKLGTMKLTHEKSWLR